MKYYSDNPISKMTGQRPSALKVNKDSHGVHKPSDHDQKNRRPVIIYTQSPKIIHTRARDFMALVQRLTGISPERTSSVVTAEETGQRRYSDGVDLNSMNSSSSSLSPTFLEFMKGLPEY